MVYAFSNATILDFKSSMIVCCSFIPSVSNAIIGLYCMDFILPSPQFESDESSGFVMDVSSAEPSTPVGCISPCTSASCTGPAGFFDVIISSGNIFSTSCAINPIDPDVVDFQSNVTPCNCFVY